MPRRDDYGAAVQHFQYGEQVLDVRPPRERYVRDPSRRPKAPNTHWCDKHDYNTSHSTEDCKVINGGRVRGDNHNHQKKIANSGRPSGFDELKPYRSTTETWDQPQAQQQLRPRTEGDKPRKSRFDVPPSQAPFGAPAGPKGYSVPHSHAPPADIPVHPSRLPQMGPSPNVSATESNGYPPGALKKAGRIPDADLELALRNLEHDQALKAALFHYIDARASSRLPEVCCWCSHPEPYHHRYCVQGSHRDRAFKVIRKIAKNVCPGCGGAAELQPEMFVDHTGDVVMMGNDEHIDGALWLHCVVRCTEWEKCGRRETEMRLRVDADDCDPEGILREESCM